VLLGIAVLLRLLGRHSEHARQWLDALRLHFPGLGHIYHLSITARFCRTLSLLLRAHTPLLDALELAAAASGSASLARAVAQAAVPIANGDPVATALRHTGFFGFVVCWLAATGEQHGRLDQALENAAEKCERDLQFHEQWLTGFAAPITIVFTGFIVGMMIFALYLPIFTLGSAISGT
jgi:type IV pilus assembly protein PilC